MNFDDPWGIPLMDDNEEFNRCPSRCLNPSWILEDSDELETRGIDHKAAIAELNTQLSRFYPQNNPADWYVLAAGDGDGMSEWLKGKRLRSYGEYVASGLSVPEKVHASFRAFLGQPKRMGPSTHSALSRALLDFSNQLAPFLTERRYAGRLIYSGGDDVLAYTNLWEWDAWLWDIRQCFQGQPDQPRQEFDHKGNYWRWNGTEIPKDIQGNPLLANRPLFTMGEAATISFGIVIAHHSVPLAIALESLWEAEDEAKKHFYHNSAGGRQKKDAVQVRVLYGNGNTLKATTKFEVFKEWRALLTVVQNLEPALFEQAAQVWEQHPVPDLQAVTPWVQAFCDRRDFFSNDVDKGIDTKALFSNQLVTFLKELWRTTQSEALDEQVSEALDEQVQSWLKLAAFLLRKRHIELPKQGGQS